MANLLEKNGNYDYKILEKKKVFNLQEGYGIQLSVNGVKLLNEIGFRQIAIHDINYPRNINFYNSKNLKLISKIEISKFNKNQNFYTTIKRSVLVNFLIKNIPKEKIILLNVDIDFVESTECVLNHFYPRIIKGGLILLDNYQGVGTVSYTHLTLPTTD